ncbi:aminotransferase class I/II-fold pyridoxal phosphate-dependent enzyme [Neobittarella massiliensis]|uniref:Aminotransferase n=2 Tax=Neobittarella massiliensis (ex Bilen et al. 2018) TaxID=2041842 RepID=A0A8J6IP47_9FIRM|nr:aminotransferase class I/II-fold pyridoxal phosphate-dependent enzyme [Neobittarella massiliensis]MBC3515303.1 aminotransferase class I/II-fold pyridoxal phosphate-dependent enzyme [Neobittarella massiliensis]
MSYDQILSDKVKMVKPSGIRKFFDLASEMEGVISLGVGEPDFDTPYSVRQAGIRSLEQGRTYYTANNGLMELREGISRYLQRRFSLSYAPKDEILVTVGGSEAIDIGVRALVNPGDEVIIPQPSFVCYEPIVQLCGGVPVIIETKVEDEFRLTAKDLKEKITSKTKLLILPFPNNPTGAIMRREDLEEIAQVLRGTDICVLSDEIYAELTYGGVKHTSIAQLDDMWERTLLVGGFSKSYAMTGWRLGYVCAPAPIVAQIKKIHQFAIMCAPTTSQYAAIEAINNCDEEIEAMRDEYDARRRFIVDAFNKMGLDCFSPRGAFYVFPCIKSTGLSSAAFCEQLLQAKKIAVVPGDAFGACGEGYLRVSYCYSIKHLKKAVEKIGEFIRELG